MKKLLAFAASISALAMTAGADDGLKSWADFEGYGEKAFSAIADDTGDAGGTYIYWSGSDDDGNVITAYGEAGQTAVRPDAAAESNNTKYLKVDSTSGITRNINAGDHAAESLEKPIYFDMDVQFTVSDQVAEPAQGDKLLVWLYGTEEMATPQLIVTAAEVDEESLVPAKYNFVVDAPAVKADEWHRLTIKATTKEFGDGEETIAVPHFMVFVDGEQVTATGVLNDADATVAYTDAADGLFGSLVVFNADGGSTITSATFQGSGALDDVVITTTEPAFLAPTLNFAIGDAQYETFAEALEDAGADDVITLLADYDVANEEIGAIELEEDATLDLGEFNLTASEADYVIFVEGATLTLLGTGSVDGGEAPAVYLDGAALVIGDENGVPTVANVVAGETDTVKIYGTEKRPTIVDEEGNTIVGTWTAEDGETGYYVFEASGEQPPEPGDETHEVDPATDSLDENGVLQLEDGESKVKIGDYDVTDAFVIDTTAGTATLKASVVAVVEEEDQEAIVVDDDNGKVTLNVKAVAGMYYGVAAADELTLARPETLTQFTGTNKDDIFTVEKPAEDKGFFKVFVDIKQ